MNNREGTKFLVYKNNIYYIIMKTIRVIIVINFFESLKINNNNRGLIIDIWGQMKKKLDKKYKKIR